MNIKSKLIVHVFSYSHFSFVIFNDFQGLYSVSTSPHPAPGSLHAIRLSCDRHLLAAAHKNIAVGPLLASLKAIQGLSNCSFFLINHNILKY